MAVLKNKRSLSKYEYEHTFNAMYEYFRIQLRKIPTRRQEWVSKPITDILRSVHMSIMELNTGYVPYKDRAQWRYNIILSAINSLMALQKPLYCYWDIVDADEKHKKNLCAHVNKEIALLHGMLKTNTFYTENDESRIKHIMYYKNEDINNAKFLSVMRALHRYTHGKAIRAKSEFDAFETRTMIELVDDAWYHCLEANKTIPENKSEYITRKNHISKAISCLHKLNRPLLSLFILMGYSESIMREWSELLTQELALLSALQKSDKKRFGKLE